MKNKKIDLLFVGIVAFFVVTGVFAATYLYQANEVTYSGDLTSNNVQDALDELYTKCEASTTTCPSGMTCVAKTNIKCQRATTLHTETCSNTSTSGYCQGGGYSLNDTITYGNTTITKGVLTVGDAFDCDVDGTGFNHRFYYISDYYDTSTKKFNDKVAVLIYYSNTTAGVASSSYAPYATKQSAIDLGYTCNESSGCNWYGPLDAVKELPTTTQWSNISLYNNTRQILTMTDDDETIGGTLPTSFDYSGYSARLLTFQEVEHICYNYKIKPTNQRGLKKCEFLFERTYYANTSNGTMGFWMESPDASYNEYVAEVYSHRQSINSTNVGSNYDFVGVRPAIEVLKSEISY